MKPAIQVENLSKEYRLGQRGSDHYRTLRESLSQAFARSFQRLRHRNNIYGSENQFWALKDISFQVQPGDVVGIIGRNGAGKSTLLKILSRIVEPTKGRAEIRGRLGSLLEVGTGFHPELTGRENIYLNGSILGMRRKEIDGRFDEIVAFSEVERFLETPVKRYSSGMYVRLAFAVAAYLESEILIVDEVLAVGDMAFQKRCLGKMDEVSRSGRAVLFVSHNLGNIIALSKKVIVLDRGQLTYCGPVGEGMEYYMNKSNALTSGDGDVSVHPNRKHGSTPIIRSIRLLNSRNEATDTFRCGAPVNIEISSHLTKPIKEIHYGVSFEDSMGCQLFTVGTHLTDVVPHMAGSEHRIRCHISELPLAPGRYYLSFQSFSNGVATDVIEHGMTMEVIAADYYFGGKLPHANRGPFLMRSKWSALGISQENDLIISSMRAG
jgi:lipopolysaccharide transport system ATP-binding protein